MNKTEPRIVASSKKCLPNKVRERTLKAKITLSLVCL